MSEENPEKNPEENPEENPVLPKLIETSEIKAREARKRGLEVEYDRTVKAAIEPEPDSQYSQDSQDSAASDYSISNAPNIYRDMYTHQQVRRDTDRMMVDKERRRFVEADAELRSNLKKLAELTSEDETLSSKVEINTDKNEEYLDFESPPIIDRRISVAANDKLSAQQVADLVASSLVQLLDNVSPDKIPEEMNRILDTPSNINYSRRLAPTNITERNIKKLNRFDLFDTAINKALDELDQKRKTPTEKFTSYFEFIKDKIYTWLGLTQGGYARGKTRRNKRNKQNKSKKGKQSNKRSKRRRRTSKRRRTHRK